MCIYLLQISGLYINQYKMSVKVGVRVRPFNKREQLLEARKCIQMQGGSTHLIDGQGHKKTFHYDYSFWSHDNYTIDPDGIYVPIDDKYADQRQVYEQIGSDILVNAWQGYNCCLFAYGQTGSGKSYSMIGYGANKGVVPIVCDQIFKKIGKNTETNKSFEVTVSMMEIYNQSLRDLLLSKKKKSELKICQHKTLGVYVQGLHKSHVTSYEQIAKKIQQGSNNRSIAATLMNESSSRSHTIVSINFVQKLAISKAQMNMKYSVIHLVDLAGSQSVGKTGVSSKDRLRETAKINQSLSTLGRVIQILAENSSKLENKTHVPYRDSKLTFILRNALGGNSRTAMICAISPADDNYQQTLSTLRYAQRAKKIQNRAIINESDVDKLIRQLRQQNEMLKKMLRQAKWNKTVINQQQIHNIEYLGSMMNLEATQQQLLLQNEDEQQQSQLNKSRQEKNTSVPATDRQIVDQNQPHITNISEDQLLSFRVKYSCKNLLVGNKFGEPKPDVVLANLGILPRHARIWIEDKDVYIEPCEDGAGDYIFLNGQNVLKKTKVFNLDRIIFGSGCIFLVRIKDGQKRKAVQQKDIDYQFAISEMNIPGSSKSVMEESQMRKQILEQIQAQYEKTKKENEDKLKHEMKEQEKIYYSKLKQIQESKNNEAKKLRQELVKREGQSKALQEQKARVAEQIQKYMAMEIELKKQKEQKEAYEQTVSILEQKMSKVKELEMQLATVTAKQEQMKEEIQAQEEKVRKELEIKTIVCTNENILTEYKLEMKKKAKNAKQLRDIFVKKEKIQLQKQLVALVPMIERFNLIAREMGKRVECGLSVQYKYISEAEITEVLKTAAYKAKFKIIIHVLNRDERRGYYWDSATFKNRYELAVDFFQLFITDPNDPKLQDKNLDPYWDPQDFTTAGSAFLSLETLFYGLSYEGKINFIHHSRQIGSLYAKVYPCDQNGDQKSLDKKESCQIQNPRDLLQKSVTFAIQLSDIRIRKSYEKFFIQYELLLDNYKMVKFQTNESVEYELNYKAVHTLKQLTENTILFLTDKPIVLNLKVLDQKLSPGSQASLTERENVASFLQTGYGQDRSPQHNRSAVLSISEFGSMSDSPSKLSTLRLPNEKAFVFQNTEVLDKIDREYNLKRAKNSLLDKKRQKQRQWAKTKKQLSSSTASKKQLKDKDCQIY